MKKLCKFLLIILSGLMIGPLNQIIALEDTSVDTQGVTLTLEQEELLLQEILAFTAYDAYAAVLQTGVSRIKDSLGSYLLYKIVFMKKSEPIKVQEYFSNEMIDMLEDNWFDHLSVWIRKMLLDSSSLKVMVLKDKLRALKEKIVELSDHSRERIYQLLRNRVGELIPVIELLTSSGKKHRIIQKEIKEYLLALTDAEFVKFNMPFELRKSLGIDFSEKYQNIVFDNIVQYMIFPQIWLERVRLKEEVERVKQLEQKQGESYRSWWEQLFGN